MQWLWKVSDSPIFKKPDAQKAHAEKAHVENRHLSKKESTKPENNKKQSKETEVTSQSDAVDFKAFWKPITGTKSQQLKQIETRFDVPDEREYDAFLIDEGLDQIREGKGGDLYNRLSFQKWHQWNGRRWFPIHDWQAYLKGLNTKIEAATRQETF